MAEDRADQKPEPQILNLLLQELFWVVLNEPINPSVLLLLPPAPVENREAVLKITRGGLED